MYHAFGCFYQVQFVIIVTVFNYINAKKLCFGKLFYRVNYCFLVFNQSAIFVNKLLKLSCIHVKL